MYIFVFFDLSTLEKRERAAYNRFRNKLLEIGFSQFQFSVYVRPSKGTEQMKRIIENVELVAPKTGSIYILKVTDRQYFEMKSIVSSAYEERKKDQTKQKESKQKIIQF